MTVVTEPMTAAALLDLPDDGRRYELIAGELIVMPPTGDEHGAIIIAIASSLNPYVREHRLGIVRASETGFLLTTNPDTVRAADIAFVARERVEREGRLRGYRRGAPDLVVEVISPSDRYTDVEDKVAVWFEGGARMVVVVNPRRQTGTVYRSPTQVRILTDADLLDGDDVVPGWQLPVTAIFEGDTL